MGWLITLCVLLLLSIIPLGARCVYNTEGFSVYIIIGSLRIKLFPNKKDNAKEKNDKKKKHHENKTKEPSVSVKKNETKDNKTAGSLTDFLPLVNVALDLLNDFRLKLRVDNLDLKLVLAGGDPCDLAVSYGKAWTALGNLLPQIERFLKIKKRDLRIECDFVSDRTQVYLNVDLTITLGRILYIAVVYGIRALREYIRISNKRKGGASYEPKSS